MPEKIWSFWHPQIFSSSFRSQDTARNPKKSRNPKIRKIQKTKNPKRIFFFWKSKKPLKFRSFWHQWISGSSFRSQDTARNPKKIRNQIFLKFQKFKKSIFWKSEKPSKFRSFWHPRISGSSFCSQDTAIIQKKSRNPVKNSIFGNMKSPQKSGFFDPRGYPPEILQ